jgi:deoxyribonucleoside regulator
MNQSREMLAYVAELYYGDGLTQKQIAEELKISRSLVSIYLSKARSEGIVEVQYKINYQHENNDELSSQIAKHFPVGKCHVVPMNNASPDLSVRIAAERAIEIVDGKIKDDYIVGLSWGSTCHTFLNLYKSKKKFGNVTVVPLTGGIFYTGDVFQMNEMSRRFAEKLEGNVIFIYAPVEAASVKEKRTYMSTSQMHYIKKRWENIDLAVFGIGISPNLRDNNDVDTITEEFILSEYLDPKIPAGDVCARYFNIYGDFIEDARSKALIAIAPEELRNVKSSVCMATGFNKIPSIIGGLNTGLIDEFIIDDQTAKKVIRMIELLKASREYRDLKKNKLRH